MAKKWSKKEINEYLGTKQISQDNYVAPTVRVNTRKEPSNVESNEPAIRSIESTVNTLNSVKSNKPKSFEFTADDKKDLVTDSTITDSNGNISVTKPIKANKKYDIDDQGNVTLYKSKLQEARDNYDDAYNKFENYRKEKGINFFNDTSKTVKSDKEYQKLKKDVQDKRNIWDLEQRTKNAKIDDGALGTVERLENSFASGFTKGIGGIESTARKLTGLTDENEMQKYDIFDPVVEESYRTSDSKPEQVAMNITGSWGQMVPQMLVGNPNAALGVGFANYGGSAYNEAKKNGATEDQATKYGIISGGTEMLMEKLLGGFENVYGKSALGKSSGDIVNKVMNKAIKNEALRKTLSGARGEFTEEYLQEFLEPIIKNVILEEKNGADFWNTMKDDVNTGLIQLGHQLFNKQNLEAGLQGALSSGIMQGPANFAIQQQAKQNGMTMDEYMNNIQPPKATPLEQKTREDLTQEQVQSNEQQPMNQIQPQIPTQTPLNTLNQGVIEQNVETPYQTETPQITPLNQVNQELQETRKNDIADSVQAMNLEKQPEFKQKQGNYVYEKHENPKIDTLRQDIAKHFTDSEETRNFAKTLEKIIEDKNVDIRFNPNLRDSQGRIANGSYSNGVITLNPNSNRAGEFLTIHELTHAIGTKPMIKMIENYRKSNAEFNNAVEKLLGTYNATEINEEALADISGQLFGNQEYINNLSMENPSLFKKIYNEIKYLWHQFRGYKNQDQFIEDLRNKWESAYRNQEVQQKAKNSNIEMSNQTDSNGNKLSNEQVDYFKDSKVRDGNGKLLKMYHGTPNGEFTIFHPGSYFSSNSEYASGYQNPGASSISYGKEVTTPKTYEVYLNITNPFTLQDAKAKKIYIEEYIKGGNSGFYDPYTSTQDYYRQFEENDIDWLEGEDLREWLKENHPEYDGLILDEGGDGGYGMAEYRWRGLSYMPFESNQIKNIDNLTPTQDDDIRYSKEETTRDNQGRELSKQQQEYFKDSKVRDKDGKLMEIYHGASTDFNVYDTKFLGKNGLNYGIGFYLTNDIEEANKYAKNGALKKQYVNIEKPLNLKKKTITENEIKNIVTELNNKYKYYKTSEELTNAINQINNLENNDYILSTIKDRFTYPSYELDDLSDRYATIMDTLKNNTKYDGIIIKSPYEKGKNIYIAFEPNQIKNVDNLNPTEDPDIRYSKDNQTWREYLEKEFPNQGTRTNLQDINERNKPKQENKTTQEEKPQEMPKNEVKQEVKKSYLTSAEQNELENLRELDNTGLLDEKDADYKRLQELEKKSQGISKKYPDLKTTNTFDDIKGIYGKYKNNEISTENNKVLRQAKNFIEANKQGRRTKDQWLQVAEFIGSNADIKSSQDLQQLAMETWFETKPNNSNVLNRQGQKYVKFPVNEWVDAVYKGAGVGTETKLSKEEKTTINEVKEDNVIKVTPNTAVENFNNAKKGEMNTIKLRSWVDTSNVSTGKTNTISQANIDAITYEVQSNKDTYNKAVKNTKNLTYGQKVFRAADKLNSNKKLTPVDLAEAQLALREAATKGDTKTYLNLQQDIAIMGTELGQMVQSLSMIQKLSPDGQLMMLNKIINRQQKLGNKNWDGVELDGNLVKKVLDSYDDETHTTFNKEKLDQAVDDLKQNLADQMKIGIDEKINEWRYLSMLGNPKTHIRNIVANVAMTVTKRTKETINAGLQDLIIRDSSKKTATLKKSSQEVKDLSKIAYNETFEVNKGNKYNEKNEIENKRQVFNNKIVENFRKLNAKALDLEDQAFKKIEFERAFSNFLTAQNIKTAQDINTHPEIVEQAKAFALNESKIATFQQENEFANWINKLDRKGPIAKVVRGAVIPFTRTPLNIAKTGIEYAPGTGLLTTIADVKKAPDNMKGNVAINGISKQITGTSLALLGYALAKSGILKSGDDDDKEGKFKKDQGLSMGFSIKLGNKFYDLSWLSPSSMPLFVGASMFEQLEKNDGINGNVIMDGIANTLDPLSEMSCISSFTNVLKSFQSGSSQMISSMAQKTGQNYLSQFIPTVSSQFARLFDTKKRTTSASKNSEFTFGEETLQQLMYKVPGLRNLLPEQTDYFGDTKKEESNLLIRGFEAFLSPANTKKEAASKEAKELLKIYDKTGETDVIPSSLYKYIKYDNENIKMSNKEWNNYKKDFGTTFRDNMKELMDSVDYEEATNEEKATMISGLMKYSKDKAKDNYLESKDMPYSYISDRVDEFVGEDYSIADYYIMKTQAPDLFKYGTNDTKRKKVDAAKELGLELNTYYKIQNHINNMDADKNENGKSISGSKKEKVIDYINSLDYLTEEQKNQILSSKYKKW